MPIMPRHHAFLVNSPGACKVDSAEAWSLHFSRITPCECRIWNWLRTVVAAATPQDHTTLDLLAQALSSPRDCYRMQKLLSEPLTFQRSCCQPGPSFSRGMGKLWNALHAVMLAQRVQTAQSSTVHH